MKRKHGKFLFLIVASITAVFCNSCTTFNTKEKIIVVTNVKYDATKADTPSNEGLTENERIDYLFDNLKKVATKNDYIIFNGGMNFHAGDTSELRTFVAKSKENLKSNLIFLCGIDGFQQSQWEYFGLQWNYLIETNKAQVLCWSANNIHEQNYDLGTVPGSFKNNKKKKIFVTPWVYARKGGSSVESYFYDYSKDEKFVCVFTGFNLNHYINAQANYMTNRNRLMPVFDGGNFSFPFQKPEDYVELAEGQYVNYAWSFDVVEFFANSCDYYMYQPERSYSTMPYKSKGKTHSLKLYEVSNLSIISGMFLASGVVYLFIAVYPLRIKREDE